MHRLHARHAIPPAFAASLARSPFAVDFEAPAVARA
jgi:hypothetical protein